MILMARNVRIALGLFLALVLLSDGMLLAAAISVSTTAGTLTYAIALVFDLAPSLFLVWKVATGRNWARLILALLLTARVLTYFSMTLRPVSAFGGGGFAIGASSTVQQFLQLCVALVQLGIVVLLFSTSSNAWFRDKAHAIIAAPQEDAPIPYLVEDQFHERKESSTSAALAVGSLNWIVTFAALYFLVGVARIPIFKMLVIMNLKIHIPAIYASAIAFALLYWASLVRSERARQLNAVSGATLAWALSPVLPLISFISLAGTLVSPCSLYEIDCSPFPFSKSITIDNVDATRERQPLIPPPVSSIDPNNVTLDAPPTNQYLVRPTGPSIQPPSMGTSSPAVIHPISPSEAIQDQRSPSIDRGRANAQSVSRSPSSTEIYKCVDSTGRMIFSGMSCGTDAKLVEVHPASPTQNQAQSQVVTSNPSIQKCQVAEFADWLSRQSQPPDVAVLNSIKSSIATKCRVMNPSP